MLRIGQQKINSLSLAVVAVLVAAAAALAITVPELMPWSFVVLAGAALLCYWAIKWEITIWAWLWVLSYGLLDWPEWRVEITGFFNMTVPRFIFLGAVLAFCLYFLVRRRPVRYDRSVMWMMLALTVYCAASATASGWLARTPVVATAPYFRFLASMVFPFIIFFLVYNATSREGQIRWAVVLLSLYGWFSLYIAYLQYAAIMGAEGARGLIWPGYINDPTYGIHFDRARGAFGSAGTQGIFLVLLFYTVLFAIRKIRGPYRAALIVQAILIPPAIFFTGVRSAYVAFGICGIIWSLMGSRGRFGAAKLAMVLLIAVVGVVMFWGNVASTKRQIGGVAQRAPIVARGILLHQTWEMLKKHPLRGVGFGHFVDAQQELQRDPATLSGMAGGVLVEHNLFLNMAAETGLIGLAGMVAVFVLIYRRSVQLYRKLPPTASGMLSREFVVLFWVAMGNYLCSAMFRDTLWDVFANASFWALAGLIAGYNRLLEPHPLDLPVAAIAE